MRTLIAIGYPDETTAAAAAAGARGARRDGGVDPEAIAVVSRNRDGDYQLDTDQRAVPGSAAWGMYWGLLFGVLLFTPAPRAAAGSRLGALLESVARDGIDAALRARVRDLPQPGTSMLFLIVDRAPEAALERLRRFGGTVLAAPLDGCPDRAFGA